MTVKEKIEKFLQAEFNPQVLEVIDESYKHAGHAGAKQGGGHFQLFIVSDKFKGLNSLRRHQLIYRSLADLMKQDIHALAIKALTAEEFAIK